MGDLYTGSSDYYMLLLKLISAISPSRVKIVIGRLHECITIPRSRAVHRVTINSNGSWQIGERAKVRTAADEIELRVKSLYCNSMLDPISPTLRGQWLIWRSKQRLSISGYGSAVLHKWPPIPFPGLTLLTPSYSVKRASTCTMGIFIWVRARAWQQYAISGRTVQQSWPF